MAKLALRRRPHCPGAPLLLLLALGAGGCWPWPGGAAAAAAPTLLLLTVLPILASSSCDASRSTSCRLISAVA